MTWEEKLAALKALTPTHLEMRAPGDWYVRAYDRSVKVGGMLHGSYGNGSCPEMAVESDWSQIALAATDHPIKVGKRYFRWYGFMWQEVQP